MQNLPSHRQLLTSLVASLSQQQQQPLRQDSGAAAGRRHLLLTLHVIFPSIVLPALDLLDRKLVARVRVAPGRGPEEQSSIHARHRDVEGLGDSKRTNRLGGGGEPGNRGRSAPSSLAGQTMDEVPLAQLYVVQSLASTLAPPRGRDPASPSRTYAVHLDAWSCSCASFALEAFASHTQPTAGASLFKSRASPSPFPRASPPSPPSEARPVGQDEQMLSFGGLSLDGLSSRGEHVPCCKHLLACLLVETWSAVMGSGVDDRIVSRQELAGIAAGVH
ncbi:hypothetical protein G6O67_005738 [Ophiocordyceps sinensis]|uniref:SWIM-type domain-containing protein n=1 Tax=Ophiocordyceps sinensis TaxID=72228 RepID=A0A8H4LWW5_9HYPO|nr:hypothetical protein G6O67_005738 [Ophiocordyceps sinensis]